MLEGMKMPTIIDVEHDGRSSKVHDDTGTQAETGDLLIATTPADLFQQGAIWLTRQSLGNNARF